MLLILGNTLSMSLILIKQGIALSPQIDLKNLPPLIVNRAARRSPMCVYHLREFLTNPDYRRKCEKASTPIDDLTASERDYANQQSIQTSYTHQRFLAEQQLSVRDYLKNRPSLTRNYSMPTHLDAPTRLRDNDFEQKSSTKQRSHSHSDSVASGRDLNDMAEESSRFSASQSSSVIYSTYLSTNGTNGFQESGDNVKSKAEHDQALDQDYLHPFSGEGEERGSTPPFLTPEISSEEASPSTSHYYSPLESQDNLSSDGEHIELPSTPEPTRQAEESGVGGHTDMDTTLRDSSALINNNPIY